MNGPTRIFVRAGIAVLAADLSLITLHLLSGGIPTFSLDAEANVPTWFSSAKLLAIALAGVYAFRVEGQAPSPPRYRPGWLAVATLFTALSMDETASLHERAARALVSRGLTGNLRATLLGGDATKDSFTWVVLFAPIAVGVFFFLATFAWTRRDRLGPLLALGAAGLFCFAAAMMIEPAAIYFTPPMATWDAALRERYRIFSTVEESFEIFGTTMLLFATWLYVARLTADQTIPSR